MKCNIDFLKIQEICDFWLKHDFLPNCLFAYNALLFTGNVELKTDFEYTHGFALYSVSYCFIENLPSLNANSHYTTNSNCFKKVANKIHYVYKAMVVLHICNRILGIPSPVYTGNKNQILMLIKF